MSLNNVVKTEEDMLQMSLDKLAIALLKCIVEYSSTVPIKRQGLALRFLRDYPRDKTPDSLYALEEALLWLEKEMMIGPDPTDPDLIFVTRRGKQTVGTPEPAAAR